MELKLTEVAERIRTLREIMGFTTQEMAETIGCTEAEYEAQKMAKRISPSPFCSNAQINLAWI